MTKASSFGKVEGQGDVNDEKFMLPEAEPRGQMRRRRWFNKGPDKPKPEATYDASLGRALHKTFFIRIWIAGMLNLCSGVSVSFVCRVAVQSLVQIP
jgi:ATP-binding cassette, subfamily C (CFTR/MRP), member 1